MSGKRMLRWLLAVPAALAGILGVVLIADALQPSPRPSYEPVRRESAIEHWRAPWTGAAPAAADGRLAAAGASPQHAARRWIVIGWDGASWNIILPMIEAGRLPHLAALMRRGAYGAMASFQPTLSPVLWTTVATGRSPAAHGILGFDVPKSKLDKRVERLTHWGKVKRQLYTNTDRRVRAIWNLLSDAGRPVLVAGYHNTYPAEEVRGLMVSNYLMQDLMSRWMHASGGVDPEVAESLVHPAKLLPQVLEVESKVRAGFAKALPRFADLDDAEAAAVLSGEGLDPQTRHRLFFLRQAYLADTFNAEIAKRFFDEISPDLALVHFQAIDLASHYDLYFHDTELYASSGLTPEQRAQLEADRRRYAKTVGAFHDYLDEWLGRLTESLPPDVGVIVMSDHGFGPVADPFRPGGHEDAPPGIVVVAGPGVRAGARIEGATLYDVFPTLAAALGLPLSQELRGHPLESAFEPGALPRPAAAVVATYETGPRYVPTTAPPAELGAEIEKQLKSLGYVK